MAKRKKVAKYATRLIESGDRMQLIGTMMSNICFNGKQNADIPEPFRKSMADTQKMWDEAAAVWHGVTKELSRG